MPLLMASDNGLPGMERAMQMLRAGGTALDTVEEGIRLVESNEQDDSVGLGGLPNALGHVELDASIMDGRTLASGAVGALQGYEHPISLARQVMQASPHVLLVGEGANRFAAEMGLGQRELLTEGARRKWRERLREFLPEAEVDQLAHRQSLMPLVTDLAGMRLAHGTVNFLALDLHGDIACGVSTSGWPWKYPGRLGDSPIIGAGNYADNRYGGAACTGYGELTIRCGTARSVVLYMKMGLELEDACREAMSDLQPLLTAHGGTVNILAIDKRGHPFGITNAAEDVPFWVMTPESIAPEQRASLRTSRPTPGVSPQAE